MDGAAMSWHQIPNDMRETYILNGYRPPSAGLYYGIKSMFTLHNETLNVWTHAMPLVYFLYYMIWDTQIWDKLDTLGGTHRYTFYAYFAGLFILFTTSSMAHLLNCAWSLKWRNVCFVLDYAAITVFGVSAAIVYYFFLRPRGDIAAMGGVSGYLGMTIGTAIIAMWTCCWTRLHPIPFCNAIRVAAFSCPFLIGSTPGFARYLTTWYYGPSVFQFNATSSMTEDNMALYGQNTDHPDDIFLQRFPKHMSLMVFGSLINAIKVPERFSPGSFDLVGHSHQLFHICIFLGIREHFWILFGDISHPSSAARIQHTSEGNSPLLALGSLTMVIFVVITIIIWFAFSIHGTREEQDYNDIPAPCTNDLGDSFSSPSSPLVDKPKQQ